MTDALCYISLILRSEGYTPLMAAVAGGNMSIIRLLVAKGADPMQADVTGEYNALTLAEADSKAEIASWLREVLKVSTTQS